MKNKILMKTFLLLVAVVFKTASMAQTDSLANLFYQNVQTNNNVLRFEDNALASVRFTNGSLNDNLQYYLRDESGAIIYPKQTNNTWNEVLFENLVLDVDYSIHISFQGQEYNVGSFHTRDNSLEPFEASENLFNALETWYEIPQETRPEAGSFLLQSSTAHFFESVAYLQALYDMPHLPNSLLEENSEANIIDIWVDYGDPSDSISTHTHLGDLEGIILNTLPPPLDPSTIDKCICQYTLQSSRLEDFESSYIDKDYNYYVTHHNKSYHQINSIYPDRSTNTFTDKKTGFAGPAKFVEFNLQGYKTDKTIHGNDGGLTSDPSTSTNKHYAGIQMKLFCAGLPKKILQRLSPYLLIDPTDPDQEFDFLIPTPAESCLCSKQVDICYRYDSDIYVEASGNDCWSWDSEATITAQDYAEVTLQQGSKAPETLKIGTHTAKVKCNANHLDKTVKTVDILAKNAKIAEINTKIANETDPVKLTTLQAELAAAQVALLASIQTADNTVNDCSSDNFQIGFQGCKQITLQSNQTSYFKMATGYKIDAEGKNCFNAKANIKSDFYLTAIMEQPNVTPNDVKYCCSKKWGNYVLGSFDGAPMTRQLAKSEVGQKFQLAGNWDAPYSYLSSNPNMVFDMNILTGGTNCDDIIFNNARVIKDKDLYFDEVSVLKTNASTLELRQIPQNEQKPINVVIIDMMGKVIFNANTNQSELIISNLPFRKGMYFVSLVSANSRKTFKVINYE